LIHQNNHWQTSGVNFYALHQLFDKLYQEVAEDVDSAAEKAVGLFGADTVNLTDQTKQLQEIATKLAVVGEASASNSLRCSLTAEKSFLKLSQETYTRLKELGELTLGLDDFIMSACNRSEERCYHLQQSLKP
jgi:starvation-inducible DNA-binding protein